MYLRVDLPVVSPFSSSAVNQICSGTVAGWSGGVPDGVTGSTSAAARSTLNSCRVCCRGPSADVSQSPIGPVDKNITPISARPIAARTNRFPIDDLAVSDPPGIPL